MGLRRPGMNRSLNRENPDILIVMIAEEQIMRGGGEDKGDQRQREGMGPLKTAAEMSGTAPKGNVFPPPSLSLVFYSLDASESPLSPSLSLSLSMNGYIFIHHHLAL
ncbi:hypothetical protein I3842_15G039000 [Carya illinoinensis]|uniref:Uncharacterized protein n=1 Tax=Carya illinoinensis TaxID=32201 RepID=A0A922D5Z3_CARIL|nr:hypothetical protein I3842_15G039000 [Carya illinoinensis]